MSDETKIQPALTPGQWAQRYIGDAAATDDAVSMGDGFDAVSFSGHQRHALAALALYGQPFGFTHEHLELLKRLADAVRTEGVTEKDEWLDEELRTGDRALLLTIVSLVKALLPPE